MNQQPSLENRESLEEWSASLATEVELLKGQLVDLQRRLAATEERRDLVNRLLELDNLQKSGIETDVTEGSLFHVVEQLPIVASNGMELEDAVALILEESGIPLHIGMIRERLIQNGVPIPGRGDDANIIVRLRKFEGRFTRTARGTYGLASWGLPSIDNARKPRPRKKVAKK
jgi:hypothetical protein